MTGTEEVKRLQKKGDVAGLINLLNEPWDGDEGLHESAVQALAALGTAAVEPLIAALQNAKRSSNPMIDPDLYLRRGAVTALGKIGDPRAIDVLLPALSDNIPMVRTAARWALGDIGEPAVPHIINLLQRMGRYGPVAGAQALTDITGQDFYDNVAAWKTWWEEHKKAKGIK